MLDKIHHFNSLHKDLNFKEIGIINELSRYGAKINGFSIDIFEKKNGYGLELRWHTINEKQAFIDQMKKMDINLTRNDFVFYPWPRKLTTELDELKYRLNLLFEIANAESKNSLNHDAQLFLKNYSV